jgi:cytochrome c oxidase assembly factor CtaG
LEPGALLVAAAYAWLYLRRWLAVRRQDGRDGEHRGASWGRLACFAGGLVLLLVALVSPVDSLSHQLAFVHMIQHLLLADLAPILLILGLTKVLLRPITKRVQAIERRAGPFGHPAFAVVAYVGAMWFWHTPVFYDAAYNHPLIHVLEHTCFFCAGFLYWWHLLSPIRSRMRLGGIGPLLYMGTTKLLVGFLGILLTFAPGLLYTAYARGFHVWGLSPHDDQAVAGAVMALEQSIVMGIALVYLFYRAINDSERETQRAERLEDAAESLRLA